MKKQPIVVGVVTTFFPSQQLIDKIPELARQCSYVVIVDDTGMVDSEFYDTNFSFFEKSSNVLYIKNNKNSGIAFSLNRGVQVALEFNPDFIVTFDDDTEFCSDYVKRCLAFYAGHLQMPIGGISMSRGVRFSNGNSKFKEKRSLITSGFFCRSSIYQNISNFPENYFIDLVDFYLSLKIRKQGLKLVELYDVGMIHKVGNMVTVDFPFRVNVFNHSPFRLYYQVRNTMPFFRDFWRVDFMFCCYILADILRIPFKALLFEDKKISRLKYCFLGLWHGVIARMGRLNE